MKQETIEIMNDDPSLDFSKAKDLAKQKARELCTDPMLLSWYDGSTGTYHPSIECGKSGKPAWVIYAEARNADIWITVKNSVEFVFAFLAVNREKGRIL